jgi:hypothetical protein
VTQELRKTLAVALASACLAAAPQLARAQTSDPLVQLLVKKGLISQSDATSLAGPGGAVSRDALVKLLQSKGLISPEEVASLPPAPAPAPPIETLATQPPPENEGLVYFHKDHPTTLTLGPVDLTVGGFLDLQGIWRSTNTGNAGGTNFFAIPYANTPAGHLGETRLNAANSRVSLMAKSSFMLGGEKTDVTGYVESDFLGNDATNAFVSSNSHVMRLRLYYVDVQRGAWEASVGQMWGWLTPSRRGLSPAPADVFFSNNFDINYQVGLTWTRAGQVRVIYHPDEHWAMGLAFENPDQFVGQGPEVLFPSALATPLATQFDAANQITTPNLFPDLIPKVAYDTDVAGRHIHVEADALLSEFRDTIPARGNAHHTALGWGVGVNGNVEVVKGLSLIADGFYSQGGGRYIFGMAPDLVVKPDGSISTVTSYSYLAGAEWKATPRTTVSAYYGAMHADPKFFLDTTSPTPRQFVGFGGPQSTTFANKDVGEASFDLAYNVWSNPQFGTLQTGVQYSYIFRRPEFVLPATPSQASLHMLIFDIRYILP